MANRHEISRRTFIKTAAELGFSAWFLATVPRVEAAQHEESVFEKEASWSVDFSKFPDGKVPSDMLRIQDGDDGDNWSSVWNNEKQMYTTDESNVRIENGKLILQVHAQEAGGQEYTSARVDTIGIFDFRYGKVEVRAKLPTGLGSFPAIWLLPDGPLVGNEPITDDQSDPFFWGQRGEVDMAEAYGAYPETVFSTMHTYDSLTSGETEENSTSTQLSDEFHTFGLEWTQTSITWTLDGEAYFTREKTDEDTAATWPFFADGQNAYLIINYALLGTGSWIEGDLTSKELEAHPDGVDKETVDGSTLEVESIQFFPLANQK